MSGYPREPTREDTDVIGARIGAQIIDNVLMLVIFFGAVFLYMAVGSATGSEGVFTGFGFLLGGGVALFYRFFLEGYWDGYTVGKKLFGIKVVKEDGRPCSYGASFGRNLLRIIDGMFYFAVGFIFMAMSDERQRLGDRVANTVVVREEPSRAPETQREREMEASRELSFDS
ncbi:RDD family protein [Halorussus halophilus]|uniref:RDD family protein n=1 Tax=Halorussus halophilus TaxID=2650975 RepID=UPI00130169B5|nr:RDD family protein [Halorussus halophilus]